MENKRVKRKNIIQNEDIKSKMGDEILFHILIKKVLRKTDIKTFLEVAKEIKVNES